MKKITYHCLMTIVVYILIGAWIQHPFNITVRENTITLGITLELALLLAFMGIWLILNMIFFRGKANPIMVSENDYDDEREKEIVAQANKIMRSVLEAGILIIVAFMSLFSYLSNNNVFFQNINYSAVASWLIILLLIASNIVYWSVCYQNYKV